MLIGWNVFLYVLISASPILGNVQPGKRSDFKMYDNQFHRVGDTDLDDEVTDCALVDHQFRRGFIRLREYLERKRGCGRIGKLNNIEGIAQSTEDDINRENIDAIAKAATEDYDFVLPSPAPTTKKTLQPKVLPQVINNFKPHKLAFVPRINPVSVIEHLKPAKPPVQQAPVGRNQPARHSLNEYQQESQHSALSFNKNPYVAVAPTSSDSNAYELGDTQSALIASAFNNEGTRLASAYNRYNTERDSKHDLLRTFYPNPPGQPLQNAPTDAPVVKVGQPLFKKMESVMDSNTRHQAPKAATNKVSTLFKDAMSNFNSFAASRLVSKASAGRARPRQPMNNNPGSDWNIVDDVHADMRDPIENDNSVGPLQTATTNAQANGNEIPEIPERPGQELRPNKQAKSPPNELTQPIALGVLPVSQMAGPTVNPPTQNMLPRPMPPAAIGGSSLPHPIINLTLLKDKILHSTNATFLRRMLALIRKITHHKDFQKLNAPARSFISQANTAVEAVNRVYNQARESSPVQEEFSSPENAPDSALSKKFQIARNPYYQTYYGYAQPYYTNLERMGYGWYNGNVP